MASPGSSRSSRKLKQEDSDSQQIGFGKNSAKSNRNRPKKRNLVRWDDDLDKQVLLTLQWALNEVGVKIPWDLVAKTMGGGITDGAIVQHLAKLRGKMQKADIQVPPTLKRGTVAKEPSKIYVNSNGRRLPPPVFATPTIQVQAKSKTSKTPPTKIKSKIKRRRSEFYDSDDEELNEYVEESDEDYGTIKKKARITKAKAQTTGSKSAAKKTKAVKANQDAATAEINEDILRILDDRGPASRTRHVKQDFSTLNPSDTDDEEEEEESDDEAARNFKMPSISSTANIKEEEPVSPRTVTQNKNAQVAQWSSDVHSGMQAPDYNFPDSGNHGVQVYQLPSTGDMIGLPTPQTSRNTSTISLGNSVLNTAGRVNFGRTPAQETSYTGYMVGTPGTQNFSLPSQYGNLSGHHTNLDHGTGDLGFGLGNAGFDVGGGALSSAGLGTHFDDAFEPDESFLDYDNWELP